MSPTEDNLLTPAELARALGANRSAITNWRDPNPKPPRKQRLNQEGKPFPDPVRVEQVEGKRPKEYFDFKQVKAWVDSLKAAPGKQGKRGPTQFRIGPDGVVAAAAVALDAEQNDADPVEALTSIVALASIAERTTAGATTLSDALGLSEVSHSPLGIDWLVTGTESEERAFRTIVEMHEKSKRTAHVDNRYMSLFDAVISTRVWHEDFRTPPEAAELAGLIAAADASVSSVLDIAAGSLVMLCSTGAALASHKDLRLVAQDLDAEMINIGRKRALVAGVDIAEARVVDSMADRRPSAEQYDVVIADPPFELPRSFRSKTESEQGDSTRLDMQFAENHGAWILPTPPVRIEQISWLEMGLAKTAPTGRTVVLMYADSPWRRGRAAEVRRELLQRGQLEAVIALPHGLRRSSRVSYVMWVLRGTARTQSLGNPDPILINARGVRLAPGRRLQMGSPSSSTLEPAPWVGHIAQAYSAWVNSGEVLQLPELNVATVAPTDFIGDPEVNLDPELHAAPHVDAADLATAKEQLENAGPTISAVAVRAANEAEGITGLAGLDDLELRWTNLRELSQSGRIDLVRGLQRRETESTDRETTQYEMVKASELREPGASEPEFLYLPTGAHPRHITQPGDVLFVHAGGRSVARVEQTGGRVITGPYVSLVRIIGDDARDLGLMPETLAFFLSSSRSGRQISGTSGRLNPLELEVPLITGAGAERLRALITELQTLRTAAQELGLEIDKAASALDVLIAAKSA